MRIYVGVTDNEWFRFLRARPELDEINFWQPSGSGHFRALAPGELFLFKLHAPENFIVGGGFFAHFSRMSHRMAWGFFGEKNGVATAEEMRRRIGKYRRQQISPFEDVTVGCIMLVQPFFFERTYWMPLPSDFSLNIVQGKGYNTDTEVGRQLWEQVQLRLLHRPVLAGEVRESSVWGEPIVVRPRLGQGTFRSLVTDLYERRCAITQEKALPVLDASHILPVKEGGRHEPANGLLFRTDIHRLFDSGYVTVTPDHRFRVSRRLKTDFDNGEPYYPFHAQDISVPRRSEDQPNSEFLEWHADTVFLG